MEEKRNIKIVGYYPLNHAEPQDCEGCGDAAWGSVLIDGLCLNCYRPLGTNMPTHIDFRSDCCGFFNVLSREGLFCNECGMNIVNAIKDRNGNNQGSIS